MDDDDREFHNSVLKYSRVDLKSPAWGRRMYSPLGLWVSVSRFSVVSTPCVNTEKSISRASDKRSGTSQNGILVRISSLSFSSRSVASLGFVSRPCSPAFFLIADITSCWRRARSKSLDE